MEMPTPMASQKDPCPYPRAGSCRGPSPSRETLLSHSAEPNTRQNVFIILSRPRSWNFLEHWQITTKQNGEGKVVLLIPKNPQIQAMHTIGSMYQITLPNSPLGILQMSKQELSSKTRGRQGHLLCALSCRAVNSDFFHSSAMFT